MITLNFADLTSRIIESKVLIKLLLAVGNEEFLEALDTFLLKDSDVRQFLSVLDEKVKKGMDTHSSEEMFVSLIHVHNFGIDNIEKYLNILNKPFSHLIEQYLQKKDYTNLSYLIWRLHSEFVTSKAKSTLESIVPCLIENYDGNIYTYVSIMCAILSISGEYTNALLHDVKKLPSYSLNILFPDYLIRNHTSVLAAARYVEYLQAYSPSDWPVFEELYINSCDDADILLDYVYFLGNANKRLVLQRLVELKDEDSLVSFIKAYPEYSYLLPLL